MPEVKVRAEGTLKFAQASAATALAAWTTATSAPTGLFAFIRNFRYTSAQRLVTPDERGRPHHHKVAGQDPIQITFQALWTGGMPSALTASGSTVPQLHLEFKATEGEVASSTGRFMQFFGCALENVAFSENDDGDTIDLTYRALGMNGPTGSGYMG